MKLTLIGYGFVGKAVYEVLKDYHEVKVVDPEYNQHVIDNKLDNLIGVLNYDLEDTKQNNTFNSLFDFGGE